MDRALNKNARSKDWKDVGRVARIDEDTIRIMGRQDLQYDVPKSLVEFNGSEVILQISKRELYKFEVTKGTEKEYSGQNVDLELLKRKIQDYLSQKGFVVTRVSSDTINSELAFHIEAESSSSLKDTILGKRSVDIVIKGAPNKFSLATTTEWKENVLGETALELGSSVISSISSSLASEIGGHIGTPIIFGSKKVLEMDLQNEIKKEIDLLKNSAQHNTAS